MGTGAVVVWLWLAVPTQQCKDGVALKRREAFTHLLEVSKSTETFAAVQKAREGLMMVEDDPTIKTGYSAEEPKAGALGPCYELYATPIKLKRRG